MATWEQFTAAAKDVATIGHERLEDHVAFLATLDEDGAPRVHPVWPLFVADRVVVRMESTSVQVGDLERDPRYALHALADSGGHGSEFAMRGAATRVADPGLLAATYDGRVASERYVVFEFEISDAVATSHAGDRIVRTRWSE